MTSALLAASLMLASLAPDPAANQAIHQLLEAQTQAWNRNDAAAFASPFLDNANFINVRGDLVKGRPAIEKIHAFLFSGPYHGSRLACTLDGITYPAGGVAVAEISMNPAGFLIRRPESLAISYSKYSSWSSISAESQP